MVGVFITAYLIDEIVLNSTLVLEERIRRFFIIIMIQIALWTIGQIKGNLFSWIAWYVDMRVTLDIQKKFYLHEHSLPIAWHRTRPIGEHIFRTESDVDGGIISMITSDWIRIFEIVYQLVWASILFSQIDPVLALISVSCLVPWMLLTHKTMSINVGLSYQAKELYQEAHAVERDIIAGLKTYKILGRTRFVSNRYIQAQSIVVRFLYKESVISRWIMGTIVWFFFESVLWDKGQWLYIWSRVMLGHYTLGEVVVITWLLGTVMGPFKNMVNLLQSFRAKMVAANRMIETFVVRPDIVDKPDAVRLRRLSGRIDFHDVTFGYDPALPVLRNFSLEVAPGERVAFVGRSGCGKSTVLNLIMRLYDVRSGRVEIDGVDVRDLRRKSFLDHTGVVLQETFLFSGSVEENVRYGNPFADEQQIWNVLRMAGLEETVRQWPRGLDTFMGEGTNISGGQKQRLGIARALIRSPSLFLMDEPTAHLDVLTEEHVMKTIESVTRNVTTLIVSHRLVPIRFVDRIVVMGAGGIESEGTHAGLLEKSPTYAALWREQIAGRNAV